MVNVTDYIAGAYLTADLVTATDPGKRKLVITKQAGYEEFPDRTAQGVLVRKLVVTVLFNGRKIDWVVSKTSARSLVKVLGSETDDWQDAIVDVDTATKGAVTYVVVKDVYNTKAVPPMRKP